jgi:dihydropteroate synthase
MYLQCASRRLIVDQPQVMGVINVTPDSFSDGGSITTPAAALAAAERMVEEGAALIDIGGVSTRPGARAVSSEEEQRRVLPAVELIAARLSTIVSVDTSNPELMRRAHESGAHMINDVRALRVPGALEALATTGMAVCLMHMRGEPETMQRRPVYQHVVREVHDHLAARIEACFAAGIAADRLCVDPGFGFGKLLRHNVELLRDLRQLTHLGPPVLVGLSRKSMAAALTRGGSEHAASTAAFPPRERLPASLALATIAVLHGARIVRAHDVAPTVAAVRVAAAIADEGTLETQPYGTEHRVV